MNRTSLRAAWCGLLVTGIVTVAASESRSSSVRDPFDYGAPELNRRMAAEIRALGQQLKLRGIIILADGERVAMIDPGGGGKNLIIRKSEKIRVEMLADKNKVKAAWTELRVRDIGETEVVLEGSPNSHQTIILR